MAPLVKSLKGLQDLLGRHQDREVQIAMLRSSAEEVATLPGGGAACMAMGTLVDRLRVDEQAARTSSPSASPSSPPNPSAHWFARLFGD